MARRSNSNEPKRKGIFGNVSFATVIASALAAGTSLVLSSRIGLTGSLIGTVIAAAASSLALQIYQAILSHSAQRLRDSSLTQPFSPTPTVDAGQTQVQAPTQTTVLPVDDPTRVLAEDGKVAASGTPIAPDAIRAAALERRAHEARRRLLLVAIVAALAALGITAAIITTATQGQGIGSTTTFSAPVTDDDAAQAGDAQDGGADTSQDQTADATDASAGTDATDEATSDATADDQAATDSSTDASTDASTSTDTADGTDSTGETSGDASSSANPGQGTGANGGDTSDSTADGAASDQASPDALANASTPGAGA